MSNLPQKRKNPDAAKIKKKKIGSALDKAPWESYEKTERKTAHSLTANSSSIAEAILTTYEYAGDSVKDPTTGDSMPSRQPGIPCQNKEKETTAFYPTRHSKDRARTLSSLRSFRFDP